MAPHRDPVRNARLVELGVDYHPWAINIPLTCDEGSRMLWHKVKSGSQTKIGGPQHSPYKNVQIPMADTEDLIEVASVCLDRPMLVNTFEWHSVHNDTNYTRLVFSLRFKPISMLAAATKLFLPP
jgi:hypothetical protein